MPTTAKLEVRTAYLRSNQLLPNPIRSYLFVFVHIFLISATSGQGTKVKLIGNDFGFESLIVQDNLIEGTRYQGQSFSPLNFGYYSFSSKSVFQLNVGYHQRTTTNNTNETEVESYIIDVSYLKQIASTNRLKLYLGIGNHCYFTLIDFKGLENTYDMGILNLRLRSLLEVKVKSSQILFDVGYGLLKYGSRSGTNWILDIDTSLNQRWTTFNSFDEAAMSLRVNVPITDKWVLSPNYKLLVTRNREYETLAILQNQIAIGIFLKL